MNKPRLLAKWFAYLPQKKRIRRLQLLVYVFTIAIILLEIAIVYLLLSLI